MKDFTQQAYRHLLQGVSARYRVVTVEEACRDSAATDVAILRHDVDRRPELALACASEAARLGVKGTFYFRIPYTFRRDIIARVADQGHEIGYHYEVLTKARGSVEEALRLFAEELSQLREVAPVDTACMHGALSGRWHNLDIWADGRLDDFGLVGEPYLSIDWNRTFYLTDTGRGWNRPGVSVRDVAGGRDRRSFASTSQLVSELRAGSLPRRIALNVHPERWVESPVLWWWDLVAQGAKNRVKSVLVRRGG